MQKLLARQFDNIIMPNQDVLLKLFSCSGIFIFCSAFPLTRLPPHRPPSNL
jgi:hypothetical protein